MMVGTTAAAAIRGVIMVATTAASVRAMMVNTSSIAISSTPRSVVVPVDVGRDLFPIETFVGLCVLRLEHGQRICLATTAQILSEARCLSARDLTVLAEVCQS